MTPEPPVHTSPAGGSPRCLQCGKDLSGASDAVTTAEGAFCRSCFEGLKQHIARAVEHQGTDINYPAAAVGAVLGGAVGAAIWWGFTVITRISFGLVAVVIGYLVGQGVLRFSGGKRAPGLQILSVGVAGAAYFYAQYLVTRTFLLRYAGQQGGGMDLPLVPDFGLLVRVVRAGFSLFDLVFLAIVVFQAWRIPAPMRFHFDRR